MRTTQTIRLFFVLVITCSINAHAHPHSWVNLTSDFVLNENTELVEVRQRWIFDTFYSALTLDDMRKQYSNDAIALKIHSDQIIENLESVDYYSHLNVNGQTIEMGKPYEWDFKTINVNDEELLILEMKFKITPTSLTVGQLSWSVYDPTFYVSMRHDSVDLLRVVNNGTAECEPNLIEASPSDEQIMYAASFDKSETTTEGMGKVFAQSARIACY